MQRSKINNILLIEDDEVCTFLTKMLLKKRWPNVNIHVAPDGIEALKFFSSLGETQTPDLMLVDLNMPKMGGFEFIREFRKLKFSAHDDIEIAIVTSSMTEGDIRMARSLGVTNYIVKPVNIEALEQVVQ